MITVQMLEDRNACSEALIFIELYDGSVEQAWRNCKRADWMLWLMRAFPNEKYRSEYLGIAKWLSENCEFPYDPSVRAAYKEIVNSANRIETIVDLLVSLSNVIIHRWDADHGSQPEVLWYAILRPWADKIREFIPIYEG